MKLRSPASCLPSCSPPARDTTQTRCPARWNATASSWSPKRTSSSSRCPSPKGSTVKAGDVVVVQDRAISAAELDAARAQLAEAESRVEELENGPRGTTIRAAVARRDAARAQRDDAVRERDRLLELVARSLVSKSEADRQVAIAADAPKPTCTKPKRICASCRKARAPNNSRRRARPPTVRAPISPACKPPPRAWKCVRRVDATIDALPYRVGEKPAAGATVAVLLATTAPYRAHPRARAACAPA